MQPDHGLSPRSSRIVATHAALAGLCPLIPVPFVDDLAIRRIVRRMVRTLFAEHGFTLPKSGAEILGASETHRLRDAVTAVALFPIKKILRKLVYVLAIKDCAEVAATVFHDGWLLAYVLEDRASAPGRDPSPEDPEFLKRVRAAMLHTYAEVDPAPLRRALLASFRGADVGVRHGIQALQRWLHDRKHKPTRDAAPAEAVQPLSTRVGAAARSEWQYMDELERVFNKYLASPSHGDPATHHPSA